MKLKKVGNNETEITLVDGSVVLYSYETPVAVVDRGARTIWRTDRRFSNTTSKHVSSFMGRWDRETGFVQGVLAQRDIELFGTREVE